MMVAWVGKFEARVSPEVEFQRRQHLGIPID